MICMPCVHTFSYLNGAPWIPDIKFIFVYLIFCPDLSSWYSSTRVFDVLILRFIYSVLGAGRTNLRPRVFPHGYVPHCHFRGRGFSLFFVCFVFRLRVDVCFEFNFSSLSPRGRTTSWGPMTTTTTTTPSDDVIDVHVHVCMEIILCTHVYTYVFIYVCASVNRKQRVVANVARIQ